MHAPLAPKPKPYLARSALLAVGAVFGVALWFLLLDLSVLPGILADEKGVLIFLATGALANALGHQRSLMAALIAVAVVDLFIIFSPVTSAIAARWPRIDAPPDSAVGAAVALSAGITPEGMLTREGVDHIITALELVRDHRAERVVTTRIEGRFPLPIGTVTSDADQSRLIQLFGGNVEWLHTPISHSTRDEATQSAALLMPKGIRRIAVVTSPMHTRRACGAFEAAGFQVWCVASRMSGPGGRIVAPWPRTRLTMFGTWIYELAGTAKYKARGWIK